jgi:hypothetical protein
MNFYKLNASYIEDEIDLKLLLNTIGTNAVSTIKVKASKMDIARKVLETFSETNGLEYRLLVEHETSTDSNTTIDELQTDDHLKQFEQYVLTNIGDSDIIREELSMVMR